MKIDRRGLGQEALLRSIEVRRAAGLDLERPVCIYDICEQHGVTVRFYDINMEGMYDRSPKPRIHLSALRPLGRRAFNCAHEFGHHLFGHGSTIDELRRDSAEPLYSDSREYLVDVFAGHLLMPTLGLGHAFVQRGWDPLTATRVQLYTIACEFGVGYGTLLKHLVYGAKELPVSRLNDLDKPLDRIRREILGHPLASPLIVLDEHTLATDLDMEVGTMLLAPPGCVPIGDVVEEETDLAGQRFFRGKRQGTGMVSRPDGTWSVNVRVSCYRYVGLAKYRHLRDEEE